MENMQDAAELLAALSGGMADAVERAGRAVVRVDGGRRRSGSGVVYAPGMVLTADHVLGREESVSVGVEGGEKLSAGIVGRDPAMDLAVLRVEGLVAEAIEVSPEAARVGQLALAVGRPSREGLRASFGVVGALGGSLRTGRGAMLERYIQTDLTPYPGLSGGALVDVRGALIGVLTTGMARGISLAIPAEIARRVAETLATEGRIRRGYLGVLSQPVRIPGAQRGALTGRRGRGVGLLVVGVEEGSPAGKGGILVGDILVALDGRPVEDTDDLRALLTGERVGREVPVEVIRGGELRTVRVTVGERG